MTEPLFDGYPDPEPETPTHSRRRAGLERRRERITETIAAGFHPLGLAAGRGPHGHVLRLLDGDGGGHTCGDCAHRYLRRLGGTYPKCELGPDSGGDATDVLARWPACTRWEAAS